MISALSYRFNPRWPRRRSSGASYFDLTEDIATSPAVTRDRRAGRAGTDLHAAVRPGAGFVSIAAHHLTQLFDTLDTVYMRVGALPQFPTNALKYNLTWSTDGLINEYCNCAKRSTTAGD